MTSDIAHGDSGPGFESGCLSGLRRSPTSSVSTRLLLLGTVLYGTLIARRLTCSMRGLAHGGATLGRTPSFTSSLRGEVINSLQGCR